MLERVYTELKKGMIQETHFIYRIIIRNCLALNTALSAHYTPTQTSVWYECVQVNYAGKALERGNMKYFRLIPRPLPRELTFEGE